MKLNSNDANAKNETVLAIESAIAGGSLSLLHNGVEIGNWLGLSDVSKAEDLLPAIDLLLSSNGVSKDDLDLVAVSAGPGSFTGIRIGIATALGLRSGLGIDMASGSALAAIAFTYRHLPRLTVAVPVGREAVCRQSFELAVDDLNAAGPPLTVREQDLLAHLAENNETTFVLHGSLYKKAAADNVVNFGFNVASAIGQWCRRHPHNIAEPLFVSKNF